MGRIARATILIPLFWVCRLSAQGVGAATEWTRAASPTAADLNAVAAASSGFYLAAGNSGTLLLSNDGLRWTAQSSGTTENLYGVALGASSAGTAWYVAVGAAGTILTSPDGIVWTTRASGTTADLKAVAYSSTFMAVGAGGTAVSSADGVTWSTVALKTTADLNALAAIVPNPENNAAGFVIAGANGTVVFPGVFSAGPLATGTTANFTAVAAQGYDTLVFGEQGAAGNVQFPSLDFPIPTWQLSASTFAGDYAAAASVVVNGTSYVAVLGRTGAVLSAGSAIPSVQLPVNLHYAGIALSASAAVVVGQGGSIWTNAASGNNRLPAAPAVSGVSATGVQFVGQTITLNTPAVAGATYQWLYNGSPIGGATLAGLTLTGLQTASSGTYSVTVTTSSSAATSTTALNVKPVADFSPSLVDSTFQGASVYAPTSLTLLSGGQALLNGIMLLNGDGRMAATAAFDQANEVIPQSDGKWIDLGYNQQATAILRFNPDGSLDSTFAVNLSGIDDPWLCLLPNGQFLLFSISISAQSVSWRRLNSDGSVDSTFSAQSLAIAGVQAVDSTSVDNQGRVYVATASGAQSIYATRPSMIFRLDTNYAVDPTFAPPSTLFAAWTVSQVQAVPGGLLYVADSGQSAQVELLTTAGAPNASYPARTFSPTPVLAPQSDGTLLALVPSGSAISTLCYNLERFDASGALDAGYGGRVVGNPSPAAPVLGGIGIHNLLPLPNGQTLVGGAFNTLNLVPAVNLARITPDTNFAATRLLNASVRAQVTPSQPLLLAGYLNGSSGTVPPTGNFLVRAAGPALASFGVPNPLPAPQLSVSSATAGLGTNSGWSGTANSAALSTLFIAVGAFPYAPGSLDAALAQPLANGPFYAQVSSLANSGIALAEAYDADPAPASPAQLRVSNFSCLDSTAAGSGQLTLGFVVSGPDVKTILIRAVGPGLSAVNVSGPSILAQPVLTLYQGSNLIASNTNLSTANNEPELLADSVEVGAFTLPAQSQDSALLVALPAGAYTAAATGKNGTSGTVLVEVYEVP